MSARGSTVGRPNVLGAGCGGGGAPDYAYQWTAPSAGEYTIDTFGSSFDTVLYVREGHCDGGELACNDDADETRQSQVTVTLAAGQTIVIVIDGWGPHSGNYNVNLRQTGVRATATPTSTATPTHPVSPTPIRTRTPTHSPSITRTQTPTVTHTATPTLPGHCAGDCDGRGDVTIDEIVTMVNIALGYTPANHCSAGDRNGDGEITIDEIVVAVSRALSGC